MPDGNVDVVRRFWDATTISRDFEAAVALAHPDAVFDWSESRAPYAGVYRGAEEGRHLWSTWAGGTLSPRSARQPPDRRPVEGGARDHA